jgi:hypothetical protein
LFANETSADSESTINRGIQGKAVPATDVSVGKSMAKSANKQEDGGEKASEPVVIEDFGEEIAGARKDMVKTWARDMQNIPEGLVVVTPLIMLGIKMWRVAIVSLVVALLEVIGVVLGFALADISTILLPYLTALAGGAMLYVISDEMIPETHAHGYEKHATFALVIGVVMMLFVQKFV